MKFALTDPDGWCEGLRPGNFPNETETLDGKKVYVTQVVTPETMNLIVRNWEQSGRPELLIDKDHQSEDSDKTTDAMGWVSDMKVEGDRLKFRSRWSEEGEGKVTGGTYRFCSLTLDAAPMDGQPEAAGATKAHRLKVTPQFVSRIALTNSPAIGGLKPISNRAPTGPTTEKPTTDTMDLSKLAGELKLPATASLEDITSAVITLKNREAEASKATVDETLTRLKNRIPAGQESYFREALTTNRAATVTLLESLPEQGQDQGKGTDKPADSIRVHNRGTAAAKTIPSGAKNEEGEPDLRSQQDKHLLELRNRMPQAKRADLVLQARAEKPEIWD